jgi:hypothetical protein
VGDKREQKEGALHRAAEKIKDAAGRREAAGEQQEGNFEGIEDAQAAERG